MILGVNGCNITAKDILKNAQMPEHMSATTLTKQINLGLEAMCYGLRSLSDRKAILCMTVQQADCEIFNESDQDNTQRMADRYEISMRMQCDYLNRQTRISACDFYAKHRQASPLGKERGLTHAMLSNCYSKAHTGSSCAIISSQKFDKSSGRILAFY